ncbi:hypothetical protein IV69_GL000624 [Weissella confusa]|nr:hypothetical protein IV69_GL000624 [Weissella confusa]
MQIEQLRTISDIALMGYYIRKSLGFEVLMDIFLKWHIQMQALVSVIHLVQLLSVKQK